MGYYQAGFDPYGIDIDLKPLRHYPFPHLCMDALEAMDRLVNGGGLTFSNGETLYLRDFSAIHASPPCQGYSMASQQWRLSGKEYPRLINDTRHRLKVIGKPYIIENVPGAPLVNPILLNAAMFGMRIRRRRLFELSFEIPLFLIPKEEPSGLRMGRPVTENSIITPVGHFSGVAITKQRMEIDWMNRGELSQAIPPAYTHFIGKHLLSHIKESISVHH